MLCIVFIILSTYSLYYVFKRNWTCLKSVSGQHIEEASFLEGEGVFI